jgi:phage-related minor tail protein
LSEDSAEGDMERLLQYMDDMDDFVWSLPLLWEQVRRMLARLVALLAGALIGVALALAASVLPLIAGVLLLAALVAAIAWVARQPVARWTARLS